MRDTLFCATSLGPHFFYALIREKNKGSKWKGGRGMKPIAKIAIGLLITFAIGYFIAPDIVPTHVDDFVVAIISTISSVAIAKVQKKPKLETKETEDR